MTIPEDEMSQEEQARLLTEPSFAHRLDDEEALLTAEFGPADASGVYGRGRGAADDEADDANSASSDGSGES